MQFLCLFSFVVVASYAAALPQPEELSGKYPNSVNNDLVSILGARSYQPVVNTLKNLLTLTSLERRDDGSKQSPEKGGESPGGDKSGTSPSTDTTSKKETEESETHLEKAERGTLALTSTINGVGEGLDVPRNVKAVGNAIDGNLKNLAVEYLTGALFVHRALKDWVEDFAKDAIIVVYETFGRTDYAKTVGLLRDTTRELIKEVRELLKKITDDMKDIIRRYGNLGVQLRNIHILFGRVFGSYMDYFKTLQAQLAKVRGAENICKYLANADKSVSQFFEKQTDIFGVWLDVFSLPANTQEGVPPTPFARALLRVCGQVFASATIPRAWLCASIVSIDKKDGDPLNPGDKRGIALINVGLKLVCKVLQMRIERFVETNNLLSYEQAGFRKREECVGQVVSLVDIIQRRQNAGLNTHVLFIDIRKAFDTVPVGALLWKLQNMGFPRRTLAFLKALYTSSSARARAGSLLSDPFPVQRGVRQGCPLSGLLFNLFINDILDDVAPITVPGLPRDTNPIRGLMYADDVAVFADSEQSLLAASTAVEQWANRWEMQFGVAKCGIISFTGHLAPRLDNPLDIRLHGQLVSRVESYKYLGVLIDSKLDHSAWLKQKRSALEHTISALHPVLANHQLTVNYRSRIFSAVVMGKAYYGLELVGGNKSHLAPLQTTINKGIRLFTGARLSTAIGPLLVETGIGSLLTRSLVSRVRLLERSVTKRTPINAICSGTDNDVFTLNVQGQLVRSQRWFWSRRTKQLYRNRYWLTPQVRPKTVKQRHSFALMETLRTCGDSASLQKYVTRQLLDTSGFFKDPSFDQSRAHGTRYLMLARMDALWTARKAIQIGILVDTHPFSVDHCILCDQQLLSTSIAHLVVECEQVAGHRIQSGLVPAIQKSRLRLLGRALDPGVENVYTWLRGGVLNGEADPDQRWLDGTVEHESMGTRHDNRALAARLADFLQVAYRQYQSTLWKYHRDRLVEVG
ncbi:hypothetical protein BASA50_004503 [Batrachochytrium salamandrivorans]|uniref:Reverse transcriptase domain-containing protein n=1 Tax=Batrachochytrium salamandrivorans TaxID=1357716 RepID=A0ABQ8FFD7_9FUNG|nr:hypothetical protein BASA50_004503 [Batrachochytrium salamandrivorans]